MIHYDAATSLATEVPTVAGHGDDLLSQALCPICRPKLRNLLRELLDEEWDDRR